MTQNDKPVLVYTTFPSGDAAEAVGRRLVEDRLAACVNIIPGMTAIYRWEGKVAQDSEVVMVIKTREALGTEVMMAVRRDHPYANPALVMLPVAGGSADYFNWLMAETDADRQN